MQLKYYTKSTLDFLHRRLGSGNIHFDFILNLISNGLCVYYVCCRKSFSYLNNGVCVFIDSCIHSLFCFSNGFSIASFILSLSLSLSPSLYLCALFGVPVVCSAHVLHLVAFAEFDWCHFFLFGTKHIIHVFYIVGAVTAFFLNVKIHIRTYESTDRKPNNIFVVAYYRRLSCVYQILRERKKKIHTKMRVIRKNDAAY